MCVCVRHVCVCEACVCVKCQYVVDVVVHWLVTLLGRVSEQLLLYVCY